MADHDGLARAKACNWLYTAQEETLAAALGQPPAADLDDAGRRERHQRLETPYGRLPIWWTGAADDVLPVVGGSPDTPPAMLRDAVKAMGETMDFVSIVDLDFAQPGDVVRLRLIYERAARGWQQLLSQEKLTDGKTRVVFTTKVRLVPMPAAPKEPGHADGDG